MATIFNPKVKTGQGIRICIDRKRKESVASGDEFLPNTRRSYLHEAYKKAADKRERDGLLAYMQRKDGLGTEQIARSLDRATSTISRWLNRAQDEGMRARHERAGRGRKHKLSESQLSQLDEDLKPGPGDCGFEGSLWDSRLMRRHIKKKFGVQYSSSGTRLLAHELGFAWKKSRPKNPKAASKHKQNEFKEAAQNLIREKTAGGFTVLAAGIFHFMFYKANGGSFCDFLERVHERYGKVLIFLDNASYHKSGGVKETLEKYDGEILLEYTLPYTPELNPVEIRYRKIKRRLSARIFDTLDDMERSVRRLSARREILPVRMFRYLTG